MPGFLAPAPWSPGEGRLDGQSLRGKAPVEAARRARRGGVRAVALVGSLGDGWREALGEAFDEVHALLPAVGPDPLAGAAERLAAAAELLDL